MRRIRRFLLVVKYSNTSGHEKEKSICIYPDHIAKPVLYPLKTASGKVLTRGFPLDTIPGERVDHPHHVGHWMNYGEEFASESIHAMADQFAIIQQTELRLEQ